MKLDDNEYLELRAMRVAAGKLIDPETAEITWRCACMFDPYNDGLDLPEELQCVGREEFVRTRSAESWIHVRDLPEAAREIILRRLNRKERDDDAVLRDLIRHDLSQPDAPSAS